MVDKTGDPGEHFSVERIAEIVEKRAILKRPILASLLADYAYDHGLADNTPGLAKRLGLSERQLRRLCFHHLPQPGESLWGYILHIARQTDSPIERLADFLEERGYLILDQEYRDVHLVLPAAVYVELEKSAKARKRSTETQIQDMLVQIVSLMLHDQEEKVIKHYKE